MDLLSHSYQLNTGLILECVPAVILLFLGDIAKTMLFLGDIAETKVVVAISIIGVLHKLRHVLSGIDGQLNLIIYVFK